MVGTTHTTSFFYADHYSIGTPARQYKCLHHQKDRPSRALENYTYNFNDGHLTSKSDVNSQVTSYVYNTPPSDCSSSDGLDRLSEIDYPDQGKISYCYNDSAPSPTITTSILIDNTVSPNLVQKTTTTMNGVGYDVRAQLTTDPDGN